MNHAARWAGLVGLACALSGCAGSASRPGPAHSPPQRQYPSEFCRPSRGLAGIGFSPLGAFTSDSSCARAARSACLQLGWWTRLRVRGEQLSGSTFGDIGQKVELLEVPDVSSCALDTLQLDGHCWAIARPASGAVDVDGGTFPSKRPPWVNRPPADAGWHHGRGTAVISFLDEAGSWETATYRAILDLAFSLGTMGTWKVEEGGVVSDVQKLSTDVVLTGMRVLGRWRDGRNAHVLVGVPAEGAVAVGGGSH